MSDRQRSRTLDEVLEREAERKRQIMGEFALILFEHGIVATKDQLEATYNTVAKASFR
jgi:hypothetical protein